MVVAPRLKGGRIENRWQPMSQEIWCWPSVSCASVSAEKIGRSGQPVQKPAGRGGTTAVSPSTCLWKVMGCSTGLAGRARAISTISGWAALAAAASAATAGCVCSDSGRLRRRNSRRPSRMTWVVYSPAMGSTSCRELRGDAGLAQHRVQVLLDVVGLAFLEQQHGALVAAEVDDLVLDDGVGHVHDVQRDAAVAEVVGQAQQLQRADDAVVQAALQDQADVGLVAVEMLVELVFLDIADGGGPAVLIFSCSCRKDAAAARCGWCRAPGFPAPAPG